MNMVRKSGLKTFGLSLQTEASSITTGVIFIHHHFMPSLHGRLTAMNLPSALFLIFVEHWAKLIPSHLLMMSTYLCRCYPLVLFPSILPLKKVLQYRTAHLDMPKVC